MPSTSNGLQSVSFARGMWTSHKARAWAKANGLNTRSPRHTKSYWRWQLANPGEYEEYHTRDVPADGGAVVTFVEGTHPDCGCPEAPGYDALARGITSETGGPAIQGGTDWGRKGPPGSYRPNPSYSGVGEGSEGKKQSKLGTEAWNFWQPKAGIWLTEVVKDVTGRGRLSGTPVGHTIERFRIVKEGRHWLVDLAGMAGRVWESYVTKADAGQEGHGPAEFGTAKQAAAALVETWESPRRVRDRAEATLIGTAPAWRLNPEDTAPPPGTLSRSAFLRGAVGEYHINNRSTGRSAVIRHPGEVGPAQPPDALEPAYTLWLGVLEEGRFTTTGGAHFRHPAAAIAAAQDWVNERQANPLDQLDDQQRRNLGLMLEHSGEGGRGMGYDVTVTRLMRELAVDRVTAENLRAALYEQHADRGTMPGPPGRRTPSSSPMSAGDTSLAGRAAAMFNPGGTFEDIYEVLRSGPLQHGVFGGTRIFLVSEAPQLGGVPVTSALMGLREPGGPYAVVTRWDDLGGYGDDLAAATAAFEAGLLAESTDELRTVLLPGSRELRGRWLGEGHRAQAPTANPSRGPGGGVQVGQTGSGKPLYRLWPLPVRSARGIWPIAARREFAQHHNFERRFTQQDHTDAIAVFDSLGGTHEDRESFDASADLHRLARPSAARTPDTGELLGEPPILAWRLNPAYLVGRHGAHPSWLRDVLDKRQRQLTFWPGRPPEAWPVDYLTPTSVAERWGGSVEQARQQLDDWVRRREFVRDGDQYRLDLAAIEERERREYERYAAEQDDLRQPEPEMWSADIDENPRTYREVREAIFADLRERGWQVSTRAHSREGYPAWGKRLKVPHATSPDGEVRLYFKTQAVYADYGSPFSLGTARSLFYDIRSRGMSTAQFVSLLVATATRRPFRHNPPRTGRGSYPWSDCMADQMKRYGNEETARKVCGSIRAKSIARHANPAGVDASPNPGRTRYDTAFDEHIDWLWDSGYFADCEGQSMRGSSSEERLDCARAMYDPETAREWLQESGYYTDEVETAPERTMVGPEPSEPYRGKGPTGAWGLDYVVPDGAAASWGARAIAVGTTTGTWGLDFLGDRMDAAGDRAARERLVAALNDPEKWAAIKDGFRALRRQGKLDGRVAGQQVLYDDGDLVVVGDTHGSHGYVYVNAWLRSDQRDESPWETDDDDEWVEADDAAPKEVMMSGQEIRARLKRGDTLVAQYSMEVSPYPRGEELVKVKRGEQFVVSAIGSGKGPDEVVALGARGRDISIAPWYVANFDVLPPDASENPWPPFGMGQPDEGGLAPGDRVRYPTFYRAGEVGLGTVTGEHDEGRGLPLWIKVRGDADGLERLYDPADLTKIDASENPTWLPGHGAAGSYRYIAPAGTRQLVLTVDFRETPEYAPEPWEWVASLTGQDIDEGQATVGTTDSTLAWLQSSEVASSTDLAGGWARTAEEAQRAAVDAAVEANVLDADTAFVVWEELNPYFTATDERGRSLGTVSADDQPAALAAMPGQIEGRPAHFQAWRQAGSEVVPSSQMTRIAADRHRPGRVTSHTDAGVTVLDLTKALREASAEQPRANFKEDLQPQFVILIGPPASGKSWFVENVIVKTKDAKGFKGRFPRFMTAPPSIRESDAQLRHLQYLAARDDYARLVAAQHSGDFAETLDDLWYQLGMGKDAERHALRSVGLRSIKASLDAGFPAFYKAASSYYASMRGRRDDDESLKREARAMFEAGVITTLKRVGDTVIVDSAGEDIVATPFPDFLRAAKDDGFTTSLVWMNSPLALSQARNEFRGATGGRKVPEDETAAAYYNMLSAVNEIAIDKNLDRFVEYVWDPGAGVTPEKWESDPLGPSAAWEARKIPKLYIFNGKWKLAQDERLSLKRRMGRTPSVTVRPS